MFNIKPLLISLIAITALILGTGCFSASDSHAQSEDSKTYTRISVDTDEAKPVNLVATIMEIHSGNSPTVVIAEKPFLIAHYRLGSQTKQTQLVDRIGMPLRLKDLEIGQRVIVKGIALPNDIYVAERIQVKPKDN